ncbi:MAG: hypothetical protein D6814_16710, partial [Calditrichaeota bacterium]
MILLLLFLAQPLWAQSLIISKSPDFSTQDTEFSFDDILYVRAEVPQIDFTAIKKNKFKLEPENNGSLYEITGNLDNNLDGTFTTSISLSGLDQTFSDWQLEVEIEDDFKNKFKSQVALTITGNSGSEGDVIITGRIKRIDSDIISIANEDIRVDAQTQITEQGNPLEFSELEVGWEVKVVAQRLADGSLLARSIEVLDRVKLGEKIEIEGRITVLTDSSFVISGLEFLVTAATEIYNKAEQEVPFSYLKVGMKVKAEGESVGNGR